MTQNYSIHVLSKNLVSQSLGLPVQELQSIDSQKLNFSDFLRILSSTFNWFSNLDIF